MSINGVYAAGQASGASSISEAGQNRFQQIQQEFSALGTALSSGNLSDAQSAFSSLQQSMPSGTQGSTSSESASNSQNPVQTAMTALQQALGTGNVSAAQTAFSQLQSVMKGHHHHGQHEGGGTSTTSSTPSSSTGVVGSTLQIAA
jgi:hypothetical protein